MSSCLSGGSRTYALDLDIITSPATSTRTSQTSSSPCSTISESSNSPLAICTRKPRTQRKRPNQTYNEAAALLSTVYPNIFSTKHPTNQARESAKSHQILADESSELLLPFRVVDDDSGCGYLLPHHQPKQDKCFSQIELKFVPSCEKPCQSPGENEIQSKGSDLDVRWEGFQEDFDAESILDEEIEEGIIDSIMGNLSVDTNVSHRTLYSDPICRNQAPSGFGIRGGVSAWRAVSEANWWNFPTVDVLEISPKLNRSSNAAGEKKKKRSKVEKNAVESKDTGESPKEDPAPKPTTAGLLLKLNYDEVVDAWSGKGSPFPDESDGAGNDVSARLAQIDLFSESGGVREASVQRYKEKRRTRLFSKKIRYQVRKVNADQRPRMKGRFVRRPSSSTSASKMKG
ncbi:protein CHLOROPLAST IMPORT APPARATUS 2-like [Syzygium oleosum]|uniref:protein CHLOROPLAST IMPORT APPARATUS 2-like n=1 Tax=Syzygium oleosum TaxID=219896 RepID=UPI0024BB7ED6|nr:protein CHLOROPLAST IMPORT APPARATUS 2-like [Syzygium oleosum]